MANPRTNGHDTVEALGGEIKALRQDFASLLGSLKDASAAHAHEAGDTVQELADRTMHRLDRASTVARRRTKLAVGKAEHAIADRPAIATAIALGVGVAAGALIQAIWRRG